MTSKLIVNSLAADTGVSTITFADQAKMGNAIFHSTGFTIGDSFLHSTGVNITNINATGVITATKFVGEVSVGSSITFEDNEKAYFGTGTDFSIYHNGSASYLDETGTGGLIAKTNTAFQVFNSAGSQPAFTVTPGGAVELYHNTTKVLETKGYGIDITGGFITTGGSIVNDGGNIKFGNDSDLQIFHDNSNNINVIQCHNGRTLHIDKDNGAENMAKFIPDGAVELYHNNVKKFETAVDRVNVTGHMVIVDGSRIYITNGFGNGAASIRNEAGNTAGNMVFTTRTAGGSDTSRAMFTTDGHFIPYANSTYDLGNTATRWRNAYVNDMHFSNEGSSNSIDGTWGDWTLQEGEDKIFMINNRTGKKYSLKMEEE